MLCFAVMRKSEDNTNSWWRPRRPQQAAKLTAWDLIYRLRSAEEAMQMPPSRAEVQAMVLAYETTAARLESMGEAEKAADLLQVFLPSFLEGEEVARHTRSHRLLGEQRIVQESRDGTPRKEEVVLE